MRVRLLSYPVVATLIAFGPQLMVLPLLAVASAAIAQQGLSADPTERWKTWQNAGSATVKTPQLRDGNVYRLTPAEIIYYSGVENHVNPVLLLVKLQHEQGLLATSSSDPAALQKRLDRAAGFGILDSDPNHTKWAGFYPQLVAASYQFGDLWKKTYASGAQAISRYSSDPTAGQKVAAIYLDYADKMNRIAGKHYSTAPTGWGYVDDFQDVGAVQIQSFLDLFPGNLKNRSLFAATTVNNGSRVVNQPLIPSQFPKDQRLTFVVQTDKPAEQVKVTFQNPIGEVILTGSGTQWTFDRSFSYPGNRPWVISVMSGGQVSDDHLRGSLNVVDSGGLPSMAKIVGTPGIPASIEQNGRLTFTVNTDKPAEKVVMVFQNPDAQAVLTGSGNNFTFDQQITSAGTRPWKLRVYANNNQIADEHIVGTLTVRAIPRGGVDSVVLPLSPMPGASQTFGNKLDYKTSACHFLGYHPGVDYAPVAVGQSVFAIADGQVVKIGQIGKTANSLGSYVVVDHPQLGVRSYYLHVVPAVGVGTKIMANQKVAAIAATTAVGKHLHLEIQKTGFGIVDSNGKPKLFVGHSTTPIGNCGYVSRLADLSKGWIDPAAFLKHPTVQAGTSQHQIDHEDVDAEDFPTLSEQKKRIDVVGLFINELIKKNYKFPGSFDEQARAAGLITGASLVRPQDNASRMEVALLAHRLLQKFAASALSATPANTFPLDEFDDTSDVNAMEYKRVLDALAAAGIVVGVRDANGEVRFFPTRKASAAEVQAIVDRTVAKLGNLSAAGPKIVGTPGIPASIEQNGRVAFTVNTDKPAEKVVMVFQNPDVEAPLTGSGTSFVFDRQIAVTGTRPWKLRVYANNNQVTDEHLAGTLTVRPVNTPSAPVMIAVQAQDALMINTPGTLVFTGNNLNANVRVTLVDCENGQTQLVSPTQLIHKCVPRKAGQLMAGWKADASVPNPINVGTVPVQDPAASVASNGTLNAKVDAFVSVWTGKPVDVDKSYGYQCVDLMHQYAKDVLGRDGEFARGNAYSIFVNTKSANLHKITNTPKVVPAKGDVIFWVPAPANGNAGHVGIFVSGNASSFTSFDQNFCVNSGSGKGDCAPRLVSHNYTGVAGWLSTATSDPAPLLPPSINIQSVIASPISVQVNQQMSFVAAVDNASDVQKADLFFPDVNVSEPMTQSGNSFSRQRVMTAAGNNRPFEVRITRKSNGQIVSRSGSYTVQAPVVLAPVVNIQSVSANPPSVQVNQQMSFVAAVDNASDVQKADLFFPDVNVSEPMTQSGNSFTRQRAMTAAGNNRPFEVRITRASNGQTVSRSGSYTVQAPVVLAPVVNIQSVSANPQSVKVGQMMSFNVAVDNPSGVERVDLFFPDVNVTEPMQQSGGNGWSRNRAMGQAGNNRPFEVRVVRKSGGVVTRSGSYSVEADMQVNILNLSTNPQSVKVGQMMSFNVTVDNPSGVERVDLFFPDVNVTEPMQQSGGNGWSRNRAMGQAGNNRPFEVRVVRKSGGVVTRSGVYSVMR